MSRFDYWVRYARRFGVEYVYECAAEEGMSAPDLERLASALASIDKRYSPPGRPVGRPTEYPPIPVEQRAERCCERCGRAIAGRADRRTCSAACRVAVARARK